MKGLFFKNSNRGNTEFKIISDVVHSVSDGRSYLEVIAMNVENGHTDFYEVYKLGPLYEKADKPALRKLTLNTKGYEGKIYGFHSFFTDPDNEAAAIVESESGEIITCYASLIRFLD